MGNEIKRDMCPEKYYAQGSVFKESVPTIIALIIVAFFSGDMFNRGGIDIVVTIIIEAAVVLILYGAIFMFLKGNKTRLAQTYISVCEYGVCGVCPLNGYKNKNFWLLYNEISDVSIKRDRLFINSDKGKVILTLRDAEGTASLIRNLKAN